MDRACLSLTLNLHCAGPALCGSNCGSRFSLRDRLKAESLSLSDRTHLGVQFLFGELHLTLSGNLFLLNDGLPLHRILEWRSRACVGGRAIGLCLDLGLAKLEFTV